VRVQPLPGRQIARGVRGARADRTARVAAVVVVECPGQIDLHRTLSYDLRARAAVAVGDRADDARFGPHERPHGDAAMRAPPELEASVRSGDPLLVRDHVAIRQQIVVAGVEAHDDDRAGDRLARRGVAHLTRDRRRHDDRKRNAAERAGRRERGGEGDLARAPADLGPRHSPLPPAIPARRVLAPDPFVSTARRAT
jgi:hypothetical protein